MGMRFLPTNAQDGSMSVIASRSPLLPASGTFNKRLCTEIGRRILDTIRDWRIHARQRSELMILNGVELRELSLTEADVNRETCMRFWERIDIGGR
jgi:uncharacterized protein YjiS (DUF1127 family)